MIDFIRSAWLLRRLTRYNRSFTIGRSAFDATRWIVSPRTGIRSTDTTLGDYSGETLREALGNALRAVQEREVRARARRGRLSAIFALMIAGAMALPGCDTLRDWTAAAIGAPTSTEIKAASEKLVEAEDRVEELQIAREEADELAAANETKAADVAARKEELRQLWARMAADAENLSGAAADAMMRTMDGLRQQMEQLEDARGRYVDVAAAYGRQASKLGSAVAGAVRDIDDAEAQLMGFEDQKRAAIAGVLSFVDVAADGAASLGVPAARETGSKVREGLAAGLSLLFGGTTVGAGILARRRKKEAEDQEEERVRLARVVNAVEKFDLLANAPKEAKAAAKDFAGPEAHLALKRALGEAKAVKAA